MSFLKASEDGTTVLASTPSPPEVSEEPVVEIDRKGTSAKPIRGRPEQSIRGPACGPEILQYGLPLPKKPNNYYQNVSATGATQLVNGNVYNHFYSNRSLFDSLTLQVADQQSAQISKTRYRAARAKTAESEPVESYAPYVCVKDRVIKDHLCHIAKLFQYIDSGFAEYFKAVVCRLPYDTVEDCLESARSRVEQMQGLGTKPPSDAKQPLRKKRTSGKKQPSGQSKDQSEPVLNLGDLGNFCEEVFGKLNTNEEARVHYATTDCVQDDLLHYLQDSFEIPYWEFMLRLFLQQSATSRSLSATVVFRVLSSLKIEVLDRRNLIPKAMSKDIEPLMKGINTRIEVLEQAWNKDISEHEASKLYQPLFQTLELDRPSNSPEQEPTTSAKTVSAWPENQQSNAKDTAIFIALIAMFFIASLIPGYKAFSISINTPGTGSTSDADFWNLLQSSVIAVLGSLMSVIPLMRRSCFSTAYTVTWALWGFGCACAIVAASIYPFCNTAWSSVVSYFGSLFSLIAVLAATQVVPKPVVSVGDKTK